MKHTGNYKYIFSALEYSKVAPIKSIPGGIGPVANPRFNYLKLRKRKRSLNK